MIDSGSEPGDVIEIDSELDWRTLARECVRGRRDAVVLVGDAACGWGSGTLVALDPTPLALVKRRDPSELAAALEQIERRRVERRRPERGATSGIALLASYDLLEPPGTTTDFVPALVAWEVNRSIAFDAAGRLRLCGVSPAFVGDLLASGPTDESAPARFQMHAARTSLPRAQYLNAVESVRREIARGEIYQANLCQMFEGESDADPWEWFIAAERQTPAPRSAFVSAAGVSVASLSPEIFLTVDTQGTIESWPIKGTRPRHEEPELDRAARRALLASEKDRAELLMIVDLERNDLSRLCLPGSVEVPILAECRSYPAVHHLVARVRGRLRHAPTVESLLRATFPGGSITGAPKLSAIRILRGLESVPRGHFTGSLFWFGDDGSVDSSILIRTCVFSDGRARIGAGGGIVSDSEPELEWRESNDKARALTRLFGLEPEAFR